MFSSIRARCRIGRLLCLSFALIVSFVSFANEQTRIEFEGEALTLETNRLVYRENHTVELDAQGQYLRSNVEYVAPDGSLIAQKSLDYSQDQLAPELVFMDKRNDQLIALSRENNKLILEKTENNVLTRETIDLDQDQIIVVDAGFDRLIVDRWDALLSNETVRFSILALTRGELISFKLETQSIESNILTLSLKPSNWLIALLVDTLYLKYDIKKQQLMEYQGLTNILAEENGQLLDTNYTARIRYSYD